MKRVLAIIFSLILFTILHPSRSYLSGNALTDINYIQEYHGNCITIINDYDINSSLVVPLKSTRIVKLSDLSNVTVFNNVVLMVVNNKVYSIKLPNSFPKVVIYNSTSSFYLWVICKYKSYYRIYNIDENAYYLIKKQTKEEYINLSNPMFYSYKFVDDMLHLNVYFESHNHYICIHYVFNNVTLVSYNITWKVSNKNVTSMIKYYHQYTRKLPFIICITPNSIIVIARPWITLNKVDGCEGYYIPSQLLSRALSLLVMNLTINYGVNGLLPIKMVFPGEYIEYAKRDSVWRLLLAVPVSASFDIMYKLIAIKYFETVYDFSRELLDILGLSNLGDLSVILDDLVALPFIEAFDIGTSYVVKWVCDYLGLPYEYHYDTPILPSRLVYWLTGNESLADEVYDVSSYFSFLTSYIYTNSDVVYPRVISSEYNIPRVLSGFAFGLAKGIEFSIVNLNPRRMYVVPEDTFFSYLPYPVAAPVSYILDSDCIDVLSTPKILSFISDYCDSIVSLYGLLWYTLTLLKHGYIQPGLIFDILWTTVQSYIIKALTGVDIL